MLRAVDISSWQAGISPSALDCDIVIVKATGGTGYENPYWRQWADEALAGGKLLGLYHFACEKGSAGTASQEAEHFLAATAPYRGRFVPILDWEADALQMPVSWAREWLEAVSASGGTPMFYGYASNINGADYSALKGYPLWMASYLNRYIGAGWVEDPANTWPTGDWGAMAMYQYTSTGRIGGWGGSLDLSIYYGDRADWLGMEGRKMDVGLHSAHIHRQMCDDDRFGYSWEERYGAYGQTWTIDGHTFDIDVGDYDCSSSTITAWKKALQGTKYAHMLDGATYTGNMRMVFLASGLFEWKPAWFDAQPGDLYLNEANHVAMCQGDGLLSEFCWGDNGAYGNQRGDQSGYEAYVHGYYSYPWDGILHYNGKADYEMSEAKWIQKGSRWWYRHADGGYTKSDWEKINDEWYYFDAEGWMVTGWVDWEGERYYCQPKTSKTGGHYGYMVTGSKTIGGKKYWFAGNGIMFRNGFRQGASGAWYCYGKSGAMVKASTLNVGSTGKVALPK